jgi:XTP/dITP diphosphohydrolase
LPHMKCVTTNTHKFAEFRRLAVPYGIELDHFDLDYPEIQDDDLGEIAVTGARAVAGTVDEEFFLEDSGIFVQALSGFPGPYSSYVQRTIGNRGIIDLMRRRDDRRAHFLSVICHYDGDFHLYKGRVDGRIAEEARGSAGFGFDPIFIPEGEERTFAEMGVEKNRVSHRGRSSEIFFRTLGNRWEQRCSSG